MQSQGIFLGRFFFFVFVWNFRLSQTRKRVRHGDNDGIFAWQTITSRGCTSNCLPFEWQRIWLWTVVRGVMKILRFHDEKIRKWENEGFSMNFKDILMIRRDLDSISNIIDDFWWLLMNPEKYSMIFLFRERNET